MQNLENETHSDVNNENVYLGHILSKLPHVLSLIDREGFSLTYGCGDRVYWCWKFTDFPGARFQEYVYFLSWLYSTEFPGNIWKSNSHILETIEAGIHYWSTIQYRDGSFDEAYPFERSLAATAFTGFYLSEGYELVRQSLSSEIRESFQKTLNRAALWLCKNDETHGVLSNHLAAAAATCYNAGVILANQAYLDRSQYFLNRIYSHQSEEGWYEEYGGADIGYQTHGTFYLARIWQKSQDHQLLESLKRANAFLQYFIHPDGSIGGDYSSRNTNFFYPAAFEILKEVCPASNKIAGFMRPYVQKSMTVGLPQMDSYNLYPLLNNYLFAYDWAKGKLHNESLPFYQEQSTEFKHAGLIIKSTSKYHVIIGTGKGGVIRVWNKQMGALAFQSTGYVFRKGKQVYSSQSLNNNPYVLNDSTLTVSTCFTKTNQRVFTPLQFIGFRMFNLTLGRFSLLARWMKNLLVKVLVKRKKTYPIELTRNIEFKDRSIRIQDKVTTFPGLHLEHYDTFCSYHMGSSRYAHLGETITRGSKNDYIDIQFSNGVITDGQINFT